MKTLRLPIVDLLDNTAAPLELMKIFYKDNGGIKEVVALDLGYSG